MTQDSEMGFGKESPEIISSIDELMLWSAPFGLKLLDTVHYLSHITALDIGSGLGFPLTELAMRLGTTSRLYGIDPWLGGVRRIQEKIRTYSITNTHVICGKAEGLPFRNRSFDLVTSNNGMNNVDDLKASFEEVARVTRQGAQFVFTFNTEKTFLEFYELYRETLYDLHLSEFNGAMLEHIRQKRKPVNFVEHLVLDSGFRVSSIQDDAFGYRFTDARALMNHFFIRLAFMESWQNIIPTRYRKEVFRRLERRLDENAERTGEIHLQVPFVTFDCERV